ncbi:MAG: hypothetical protein AAF623_20960, partial [Planctomycetota bacterium]
DDRSLRNLESYFVHAIRTGGRVVADADEIKFAFMAALNAKQDRLLKMGRIHAFLTTMEKSDIRHRLNHRAAWIHDELKRC